MTPRRKSVAAQDAVWAANTVSTSDGWHSHESRWCCQSSDTEEEPASTTRPAQCLFHIRHHAQHRTSKNKRGHACGIFEAYNKDPKWVDAPEHSRERAGIFAANTPRYESDQHGDACTHHGLHQPYSHNMLAKESVYGRENRGYMGGRS